nr:hypothetical protein [Pelagibacteraceae bacterium]
MKLIFIILYLAFLSNSGFSQDIFKTNDHILKFESNNITLDREKNINEIKIKSFKNIFSNILSSADFKKINTDNIVFINNFILNLKINNEKIIKNNYYSKISINYNKQLIINYLIENQIGFVDYLPSNFLIIIFEQDNIKNNLLSKDNIFYKYLMGENKKLIDNFFLIPDLDHNDRYLYDKNHFLNNAFIKNNKLNNKYGTDYQILVHSIKQDGFYSINVFLFYDNIKYLVLDIKTHKLNFENFFNQIKLSTLDKWKELNKIDTKVINFLNCKININNISELRYVRSKFDQNIMVKKFNLKTIKLYENTYQISFFGNINIFINSLQRDRLELSINQNYCSINLI